MATIERIIPGVVADDGSVHYSSVTSPPDDSTAVCYMVPDRIVPVIFIPGVMGTNLRTSAKPSKPVWLADSSLSVAANWGLRGADKRKLGLDPKITEVYDGGAIPQGTAQKDVELKRRGWGEVANMSYGTFLPWLENALNDADVCMTGLRNSLMKKVVASAPGVQPLSADEVGLSYKYQFPVHAVGYNWLQSNADSGERLAERIEYFMSYYRKKGRRCEKVILVTHSMGGLVSRYYSEVLGGSKNVLGIVHGVMPATGSATAYKRVKAGTEMPAGVVLGIDAAEVTAVFAQSPGALQLLPSPEYGMGWLKIRDGSQNVTLPKVDPYTEIYTMRGAWWALCDESLINPVDSRKATVDSDWARYKGLILDDVLPFHKSIGKRYHSNTYAFYGDDSVHKTWGDVVWERKITSVLKRFDSYAKIDDLTAGKVLQDLGQGEQDLLQRTANQPIATGFVLKNAAENGDGTVPIRSGAAPAGHVKVCVPYPGVDHEGAYKALPQQLFALWAITKIAYSIRETSMAYKE